MVKNTPANDEIQTGRKPDPGCVYADLSQIQMSR